jgi:hypothetical protein
VLYVECREQGEREASPTAAIIDSQSVKSAEKGGPASIRMHTTKPDSSQNTAEMAVDLFDSWLDPIETEVRARAREFIEPETTSPSIPTNPATAPRRGLLVSQST